MNQRILFLIILIMYTVNCFSNEQDTVRASKKPWTILIYAAADNNLRNFAAYNIKQMATIGSNAGVNILVHLDIRLIGNRKTTRRYYIEKNNVIHVNAADEHKPPMDSGDPQTLMSAAKWAIESYPAEHYALIFWNHGTGIIDPVGGRLLNMEDLYFYNPETGTYDLDRTVGFIDLLEMLNDPKGICWDDTTGNYLTNQKLEFALREICNNYLHGKKLDVIGFDACLMAMVEIAEIIKKFAHYQVGSEEVEPGKGWNYNLALATVDQKVPTAEEFARGIVGAYASAYNKVTRDYTLSAFNLAHMPALETNINDVAQLLLQAITLDPPAIKTLIRTCKSNAHCVHFDEPSYKDLYQLYQNLTDQLRSIAQGQSKVPPSFVQAIQAKLEEGRHIIKNAVIANTTGPNLAKAQGISIYFPEKRIHPSYKKTNFAQNNKWSELIMQVLV